MTIDIQHEEKVVSGAATGASGFCFWARILFLTYLWCNRQVKFFGPMGEFKLQKN